MLAGLERRRIRPSRVLSGTLRRQRDSAAPLATAAAAELEIDERWNEYDDRDILTHHGNPAVGLERQAGERQIGSREFQTILNEALHSWIAAQADGPCAETWPQFLARLTAALDGLAGSLAKGETAAVISSGGAIAALTSALLRVAPEALIAFNHVSINTGITKLTVGRGGTNLLSSNEHAHLEEAGAELISYR